MPPSKLVDAHGRPLRAPAIGAVNNNWWHWTNQFVQSLTNPDEVGVDTYERMVDTDDTVQNCVEYITLAALCRLGEYQHEDEEIQDFVRKQFETMDGSLPAAVCEILSAVWAGYSVTEILWNYVESRIGLGGLQTLHPLSITFDIHRDGPKKNKLSAIKQWEFQGAQAAEIPPEKAIVYVHRMRFGNYYGRSRLRAAWKWWFAKDLMIKAWVMTQERYGSPISIGKTEDGNITIQNPDGTTMTGFEYMTQVLDSLSYKSSLAINTGMEVEVVYPQRAFGADFKLILDRCDQGIARSLLVPRLVGENSDTGAYALGQKHYDQFYLMLEQLLNEIIDVLIEQLVRRLIEYNFGPQDDYGDFAIERYEPEDGKLLAETWKILADAKFIHPDREDDANIVREQAGFPEMTQEDLDGMQPDPMLMPQPGAALPKPGQPVPKAPPKQYGEGHGRGRKPTKLRRLAEMQNLPFRSRAAQAILSAALRA